MQTDPSRDMETSPHIQITIDDQPVSGRFLHRSEKELAVSLESPVSGFSTCVFCSVMGGEGDVKSGWTGAEGKQLAEGLLSHLYHITRYLSDHRDELVAAYRDYSTQMRDLRKSTDALSTYYFGLALENLYKDLEADRITYQQHLERTVEYRIMHSSFHERAENIRRKFFNEHFPFEVKEDIREQVLVWLRRCC